MICPSCKKEYDDNQIPNFCGHCGISFGSIRINTSADIMDKLKVIYKEIESFCSQLEETNKQLLAQNQEIVSLADVLKTENEGLRKENDRFARENSQLREECDKVRQDNEALHKETDILRGEAKTLHDEIEKNREDFALLQKTASDTIENNLSGNMDQYEPDDRKIPKQKEVSEDAQSTKSESEQSTNNFMVERETQIGFNHSVPDSSVTKDNGSDAVYEKFVSEEKTKFFIAFLNGERNLPEGFNKLTVYNSCSETEYIVYIYGSTDTTGSINVYPGQEFRMAEVGSFYDLMFGGRNEKEVDSYATRNILSIAPCELERVSNGCVMVTGTGFVEFEPIDQEGFSAADMTENEKMNSDTVPINDELHEEEQFDEIEDISSNFLEFFNNYKGAELPKRFKEIKIKADEKNIKLDEKTGSLFYADGLNGPGEQILLYPCREAKMRLTKKKNSIFFEIKTINFSFKDIAEADYAVEIEPCVAVNEHGNIRIINRGKIMLGCGKIDKNGADTSSSDLNTNNGSDQTSRNGSQRSNRQIIQSVNYSNGAQKYNTHKYTYDVMPSDTLTAGNRHDPSTFADTAEKIGTASAEKASVSDIPVVLTANKQDHFLCYMNKVPGFEWPDSSFKNVNLNTSDGMIQEAETGYSFYVLEEDNESNVKIYPSRDINTTQFKRYYQPLFDCSGKGNVSSLTPCAAVRNEDGSYTIVAKGKVIFANEDVMPGTKTRANAVLSTTKNTAKAASKPMTDDVEFIEFFNSKNIALPPKFIKILLSMADGEVRENNSGYSCYIVDDDMNGKVKIFPGRDIKVSGFMRYYKAAFDCSDFMEGKKTISGILPCEAIRNADGSYDILKKGIVKF